MLSLTSVAPRVVPPFGEGDHIVAADSLLEQGSDLGVAVNPHVGGEQRMVVCIAGKSYLYNRSKDFVFHKDWNIYAPADVLKLIAKGVTDYDAI